MASSIQLIIGGTTYSEWTSATISQSLDSLAISAEFQAIDLWRGRSIPFEAEDECTVKVEGQTYFQGFIDDPAVSYSSGEHSLTISCRSSTGQLVDSSAIHKTGKWTDQTADKIITDIVSAYGIDVEVQADMGAPVDKFKLSDGMSVWDAIDDLAQQRAFMVITGTRGQLILTKPAGATGLDKVRGPISNPNGDVIRASKNNSILGRFSEIVVKGQAQGRLGFSGKDASRNFGSSKDSTIRLFRPLVIMSSGTFDDLQRTADFERNRRMGEGRRMNYTLGKLSEPQGPWRVNKLVRVKDTEMRVDEDLLIASVTLEESSDGTREASLGLVQKSAYDTIEPPSKKRGKGL